jgi:hypothetical protein
LCLGASLFDRLQQLQAVRLRHVGDEEGDRPWRLAFAGGAKGTLERSGDALQVGKLIDDERALAADALDEAGFPQYFEGAFGGDPADLELRRQLHLGGDPVARAQGATADLLEHVRADPLVQQSHDVSPPGRSG